MVRRSLPCPSEEMAAFEEVVALQIHSISIDLGNTTFHLVASGAAGKVLVKECFTQKQHPIL